MTLYLKPLAQSNREQHEYLDSGRVQPYDRLPILTGRHQGQKHCTPLVGASESTWIAAVTWFLAQSRLLYTAF
jgi:hypothetical protein